MTANTLELLAQDYREVAEKIWDVVAPLDPTERPDPAEVEEWFSREVAMSDLSPELRHDIVGIARLVATALALDLSRDSIDIRVGARPDGEQRVLVGVLDLDAKHNATMS